MRHLFIVLFFTFSPFLLFSQIDSAIFSKSNKQSILFSEEGLQNGVLHLFDGGGFILNNNYVALCKHEFVNDANCKIISAMVKYNISYSGKNMVYDSVLIDINYKPKHNQFDFYNTTLNEENKDFDFLILRLKKSINIPKAEFDTTEIKKDDLFYSFGVTGNDEEIERHSTNLVYTFVSIGKLFNYYVFMGDVGEGFSGSPIYNSKGKIIAIIQRGVDNLLPDFYSKSNLRRQTKDYIIAQYAIGKKMCFAIPISTLIKRYMKGYL